LKVVLIAIAQNAANARYGKQRQINVCFQMVEGWPPYRAAEFPVEITGQPGFRDVVLTPKKAATAPIGLTGIL
jgi:hypothetical protein